MTKEYKNKVSVQKGKIDCANPELSMKRPGSVQRNIPSMKEMSRYEASLERSEQLIDIKDGGTLKYNEPKR